MESRIGATAAAIALALASSGNPLAAQLAPQNEAGISMAAVHLIVPDPDSFGRIWTEVFGAPVSALGAARLVKIPGIYLVLHRGAPSAGSDGATVDHEGFLVPDHEAVKATLSARSYPITLENAANRQVTFEFPGGAKFEFSGVDGLDVPIAHHHVHMFLPEREDLRSWYTRMFGATASARGAFISAIFPAGGASTGGGACRQEAGDFRCPRIDFANAQEARATNGGRAIDRIGFEVGGLDAFLGRLEASGVTVETPPQDMQGLGVRRAVVVDPLGTRIELTQGLAGR